MSETRWIVGPRASGRSTELIRISAALDLLIITCDNNRADFLYKMAQGMGETIRKPVPFYRWIRNSRQYYGYKMDHKGILVDDADSILSCLLHAPICAAVIESGDYVHRARLAEMGIEV